MVPAAILQPDLSPSVSETDRAGGNIFAERADQTPLGQRAAPANFVRIVRWSRVRDSFLPTSHAVPTLTATRTSNTTQRIRAAESQIHRIRKESGKKATRVGCPIKTNLRTLVVTALSAVALNAAPPVLAGTAVLPPNGETTYVTHYTGRVLGTEYLGDGASESLVELTGVSRNAVGQPPFDAMSAHCLMLSAIIGGKPRRYGACTQTDRDGDHAFTSFDGAAFKLIGGTGKYKGISGSGLASVMPEPSLEQGQYGYVMESATTWTIQPAPSPVDGKAAAASVAGEPSCASPLMVAACCCNRR